MKQVTSPDGTRIAYDRGGTGPPLLLVHGTAADHRSWSAVVPALRERFTVYAMDRRGRGQSGDASEYDIQREFEDVAAVAGAADGPVNLLGHSYGAICSMGGGPLVDELRRLVLYEPPLWAEARPGVPDDLLERMETLAEHGAHEAILQTYFGEVIGDHGRFEAMQSAPGYDMRLAAADALPREVRGRLEYRPGPEAFSSVTAPTRFLLGTESPNALVASTEAARWLLPDSDLVRLEGQGHAAMNTAPERFVSSVLEFIDDGDRVSGHP